MIYHQDFASFCSSKKPKHKFLKFCFSKRKKDNFWILQSFSFWKRHLLKQVGHQINMKNIFLIFFFPTFVIKKIITIRWRKILKSLKDIKFTPLKVFFTPYHIYTLYRDFYTYLLCICINKETWRHPRPSPLAHVARESL